MGLEPNISFIDTPEDIRETYQYFTEADMSKLKVAGYDKEFYSLGERNTGLCAAILNGRAYFLRNSHLGYIYSDTYSLPLWPLKKQGQIGCSLSNTQLGLIYIKLNCKLLISVT